MNSIFVDSAEPLSWLSYLFISAAIVVLSIIIFDFFKRKK